MVIGILIALSINNWNEERKDSVKQEIYIQRLKSDLVKDTIILHNYISRTESEIRHWENIKTKIEDPSATLDSIIEQFINSLIGSIPMLNEMNDATFKSLLSTGDIELFQKDRMEILMAFYDSMESHYSFVLHWQDESITNFEETMAEFGFLTKRKKNNLIYKELRRELDQSKFLRMFDVIVGRRSYFSKLNKNAAEDILNETKRVLETLNQPPD